MSKVSLKEIKNFLRTYKYIIEVRKTKKGVQIKVPPHHLFNKPAIQFHCTFMNNPVSGISYEFPDDNLFVIMPPEKYQTSLENILDALCKERGYAYEAIDFVDEKNESVDVKDFPNFFKIDEVN